MFNFLQRYQWAVYMLVLISLSSCDTEKAPIALGTIERDRLVYPATANEIITNLPVKEGAYVNKGTLLVQLDNTLQKLKVNKAQANVDAANANLEKLTHGSRVEEIAAARADVRSQKALLQDQEAELSRFKVLLKKGLVSQSQVDAALAARDARSANLEHVNQALIRLEKGARVEELDAEYAKLAEAKAILSIEEKHLADLQIVATRDGLLDSLGAELGERVTVNRPLATLLVNDSPYVRFFLPQEYRAKYKVNSILKIKMDGQKKLIEGRIRWLSNEPMYTPYYALNQHERDRLVYLAEVALPSSSAELPPGMPVSVQLQ